MSNPHPAHGQRLQQLHGAFGVDRFGRQAESFARFFGTPQFLIGQTVVVAVWIAVNVAAVSLRWDPYPFILLNLAFSLQAAYAAPLILLAQTRQADRDKAMSEADADHREMLAQDTLRREQQSAEELARLRSLIEANTELTEQVQRLTVEIRTYVTPNGPEPGGVG